jgi:hypothetical protein
MKIQNLPWNKISILLFVLAAKASSGPPFLTDDPEPVDYRHWEFYIASLQQFDRHQSEVTSPHFELNYGVIPDVQLHLIAPLEYVHSAGGTHYGYSDTELGVKYRFVEETESIPQVGVFPLVELPTGDQNEELGTGKAQVYFPLWIQKSWGKFTTYAGGGFWYNPGAGEKNWTFEGWEFQYDFSEIVTLGGEIYHQSANSQDSPSSSGFNFGGFINLNNNDHILFSAGRSMSGATTITGYIGFQLTI